MPEAKEPASAPTTKPESDTDGSTSSGSLIPHVFAGIAGRVGAETFKSPFDLLKVRRQHNLKLQTQALPVALYSVMRDEGLNAWRGLPPRLIWSAPLAGATFTYYQVLKQETGGNSSEGSLSMKTVLGGPAVLAFSVALRTPFDIVEQQLQLANAEPSKPAAAATAAKAAAPPTGGATAAAAAEPLTPTPRAIAANIHATWQAEGVRGVWRGYPAAFLGITTYVAGYFCIYEGARRAIESQGLFEKQPTVTHLFAGGIGGGLTAVLATPFDTLKVRMQTKIYATAANPFPSFMDVLRATLKEAGQMGLWRGGTYRFVSNAPSGAIMFAVYESGYRWIERKFYSSEKLRE